MATEESNTMNESYPTAPGLKSLFENVQIQNFLHRHGLATSGRIPLRKEEIEERLQQIDDQSSVDVVTQSVIETALDIKRPLRKTGKRTSARNSKQSIENNPSVTIFDNSCAITMIYCGPKSLRSDTLYSFKIQGDEVIIMQHQSTTGSFMVYKSFLRPNDEFTFKSHRLLDTPFTIAIYINGVIDSRVSTCCEQGYLKQRHLQSRRSLFQLLFVSGGIPCDTCQANDLMDSSISDDEEIKSEWISLANTDHTALSSCFRTSSQISPTSEPTGITDSPKTYKTKSDSTTIPSISIPTNTEQSPEVIKKQSAPTIEKMLDNEESENDLKNQNKLTDSIHEIIKQTDTSTFKHSKNDTAQIKITNDEEEEEEEEKGHKLISSVANHEMQQLLSKYLLLLLPLPKSRINNNKISITTNTLMPKTIQQLAVPLSSHPKMTSQSTLQRENVDTSVLIWFDITRTMNEDTIISQTKLRSIVNSLFTFHTIDETINFIRNAKEEKIFLIISGSFGWELIERIEIKELSQLDSIYIFCHDKSKHKILIEQNHKIRGIFTHINPLCIRLKEDLKQTLNDLLPISIISNTSNKNKSTIDTQKQVAFLCAQLHRELLLTLEYSTDERLDLIQYCMNIYQNNEIEEFAKEYHPAKAIWWYTRSTFLHKILHTALLRQDISLLYKLHFFIKDLHIQLEQLYNLYKPSLESRTFTVYRGLGMPMKIFDKLIRQEVNNLLSFDTFLLTNLNKNFALQNAQNKSNNTDESILFQIEIDTNKFKYPFADISRLSAVESADEILFSIGTTFRIDRVKEEEINDEKMWTVYLSSIDENDKQLKREIKQIQITLLHFFKRIWQVQIKRGDPQQIATSYVNMANICYKQNQYEKSLDFYQKTLEYILELSSPDPLIIATYQSNIGMIYIALEQQEEALKFYEQALKIRMKCCEENDPLLIDTLHTIGYIYREKKEFNKALKQYHKALKIQPISFESSLSHNLLSIAATYINIALVYYQQDKFDKALDYFLQALDYQHEYLSKNHPILVFLYTNIGSIYYQLKQFDSALKYQLLTLQVEEHTLPKDHKTLVITYTNIATTYEQLQDYDQAINYAKNAVNQLKLHRSKDNSDIQIKQAYLDKLLKDKNK